MEQGNALILGRDLVSARRDPHGRRWTTSAGVKEGMLSEAWNAEDGQSASASLRLARVPGGDSDRDGKFRRMPNFSTPIAFILHNIHTGKKSAQPLPQKHIDIRR